VHERGGKTVARCPACAEAGGDRKGEHLFLKADGRFGCVQFPGADGEAHRKRIFELAGIPKQKTMRGATWPTLDQAITIFQRKLRMQATRRDCYHNEEGEEVLVVVRFDSAEGKQYRPFSRNGSGWSAKDPPGRLPLFGLRELIARPKERVFIVEGEKCASELATLGPLATTSAHGAKSAQKTDWQPLAGREVVILPDNDQEGRVYAQAVSAILARLSPRAEVMIVELPGVPRSGDCVQWLEMRDAQTPEQILAELEYLIAQRCGMKKSSESETDQVAYFDAGRNCYWIRDDCGCWISLNETQFKRVLRMRGISPGMLQGAHVSLLTCI
jgi:hypothetical protein